MNLISYVLLGAIALGAWFALRVYRRAGSCSCGDDCGKCGGNCSCCNKR